MGSLELSPKFHPLDGFCTFGFIQWSVSREFCTSGLLLSTGVSSILLVCSFSSFLTSLGLSLVSPFSSVWLVFSSSSLNSVSEIFSCFVLSVSSDGAASEIRVFVLSLDSSLLSVSSALISCVLSSTLIGSHSILL